MVSQGPAKPSFMVTWSPGSIPGSSASKISPHAKPAEDLVWKDKHMKERKYIVPESDLLKLLRNYWGSLGEMGKIKEVMNSYEIYFEKEDITLWEE